MATLWFILVALMLVAYGVLDGFDLGVGMLAPWVARGHGERRQVIRSIGPVWDGNEVWLIAAGGALFFAFPPVYAASFSGFYLPLMMVLWLLMGRGIGVELRGHVHDPLAWTFFDNLFSIASLLLAIFFGAALGNVVRGVPLGADGYFFEPLWTDFRVGPHPGVLDGYTVLAGVVAAVTLAVHGAHYLIVKTEGDVQARALRVAAILWPVLVLVTIGSLAATLAIRPQLLANFSARPWGWLIPVAVVAALAAMPFYRSRGQGKGAFAASTLFIAAMLGGAAFALYPVLLTSSLDPAYSLTVENARTGDYSLGVGLIWWSFGMLLAIGYFTFLYRSFRGKVSLGEGEGY